MDNFIEDVLNTINLFDVAIILIFFYCVIQCFLKGSGNPSESAIVGFDLQPPQVRDQRDSEGDSTSAGIVVP